MRDEDKSIAIDGNNSGPIIQAGTVVYARWAVALALVAIVALTVFGVVAVQSDTADAPTPVSDAARQQPPTTTPAPTTPPTTQAPTTVPRTTQPTYTSVYTAERTLGPTDIDRGTPQRETYGDEDFWVDHPPPIGNGPGAATLYGGPRFQPAPTVAEWDGDQPPTPDECADLVQRKGTVSVRMHESGRYCVLGEDDHVALLDDVDLSGTDAIAFVTVWKLA